MTPAEHPVVAFRDAGQPRPMAQRLIATAHRHDHGWSLAITDGDGSVETATFEAAVSALIARTGLTRLLITWTQR